MEGLIFNPEGTKKFPGVIFVHGHRSSAWDSSLFGYLLAHAGFAAFLPSQVGYGLSAGEPDFCGPTTVRGVLDGIKIFLKGDFVNRDKIGIWGISRGAMVAASVAVKEPDLFKAGVLQSGHYELKTHHETTTIEEIRETITKETGGLNEEAIRKRSPLYEIEKINFPVLILHGEKDERVSVNQAKMLAERFQVLNKPFEMVLLPEMGHFITKETRRAYAFPFLDKHLKRE